MAAISLRPKPTARRVKKPVAANPFPQAERAHAYARDVMAGRIPAGKYVRAACERHLDDLENGAARGLIWRKEKAESALIFFEDVLFIKPDVPFKLDPFQAFIIGSLFGWYRRDDGDGLRRRFRTFYGEMGKGNGKTPLGAGIGLYGLVLDDEHAPEVYPFAAAKEQAKICFHDACEMVKASPELRGKIRILTNSLSIPGRLAVLRPLSSEDRGQHGLRVHMGIGDEIHAHGSAAMIDTVEAGTKNCRNALIVLITNSGSDRRSACWAYHTRALQMLAGKPDDDFFAYVCTIDPCKPCAARGKPQVDTKCERCMSFLKNETRWVEANPGFGTILDRDYVRRRVGLYHQMPSKRSNVLQLNFCLWTQSDEGWADMQAWRNACLDTSLKPEDFAGQPCWIGLDAANRVDATCMSLIFERQPGSGMLDPEKLSAAAKQAIAEAMGMAAETPRDGESAAADGQEKLTAAAAKIAAAGYAWFLRTYVPEAMVENSAQLNFEAYNTWREQNHLIVTPGTITDFARIEDDLQKLAEQFSIRRLQADPRELGYLLQRVAGWANFEVLEVAQGPTMISQPMKMAEGLIAAGLLKHNGDPVLDWMLGNVVQKTTRTGGPVKYYYPTRSSEEKKIDGAVSGIIALDGALRQAAPQGDPGIIML